MALSLARVYQAEVLLCHVVDTQSLEALNHLGLALPSEESAQKKKPLRHQARVNARRLLGLEEAKGLSIRRLLAEGAPFVEIARMARSEKMSLVVMGSHGGKAGAVSRERAEALAKFALEGPSADRVLGRL